MNPFSSSALHAAGRYPGRSRSAPPSRLGASIRLALAGHRPGERPEGEARPALAVLGRSNVGKSSLLNGLLGANVARVSATPGRTQALYWYRVDEAFDVIDCPGYGFAKAPQKVRDHLERLVEGLLTGEPRPDLALLLVDGRLFPQESDRSMALFLASAGIPTVVAATKWDAVKPSARSRQLRALAAEFEVKGTRPLLPVSAETGESLNALVRLLRERIGARRGGRAPSGASVIPA